MEDVRSCYTFRFNFDVYACDKQVPKSCALLKEFTACSLSSSDVSSLIRTIDQSILRPGNPKEVYITNCEKRGGKVKGERGAGDIGYINNSVVVDHKGQCYPCTVRRVDCEILCQSNGTRSVQCKSCQMLRSTLSSLICRQKMNTHNYTTVSSHTKYSTLTSY